MVNLILSSTKGNQGLRCFPYTGYLGLTPIRVEGIVRTKLDADLRPLPAKSITISVRCYESRIGRVNTLYSNILVDYTQVLWSKSDNLDFHPIGDLEFPFRISLPAKVAGFSTAVFVDYRCVWRIEAVLNHVPITGVGSRQIRHFELPLVRYDLPLLPSLPSPIYLNQETSKPRAPRLRYSIHAPTLPIGPLDLVSIPIHLQPLENNVLIRNASVIVERRIILHDQHLPSSPPLNTPPLLPNGSSSSLTKPSLSSSPFLQLSFPKHSPPYSPSLSFQESEPELGASSSTLTLASSLPTLTPGTYLPPSFSVVSDTATLLPTSPSYQNQLPPSSSSQHSSSKVTVNPIAGAESSGQFSHDGKGTWNKTLTLQWPAAKSHGRWAIGETINSELVSVQYFLRTKIVVTSSTGTETVELAEQELLIVSTNEAERQLAFAKYNEIQDAAVVLEGTTRSKSKSPRRSRPERDNAIPPSPGVSSMPSSYQRSKSTGTSRRPHTSAGPRDKPINFSGGVYQQQHRGHEDDECHTSICGETPAGALDSGKGSAGKRRSEFVLTRPPRPENRQLRGVGSGFLIGNGNGSGAVNGIANGKGKEKENANIDNQRGAATNGIIAGGHGNNISNFWSSVHSNHVPSSPRVIKDSVSTGSTNSGVSSMSSSCQSGDSETSDHMKEWEEELAQIEIRSRRSSDLLGFSGKKKRSAGDTEISTPQ